MSLKLPQTTPSCALIGRKVTVRPAYMGGHTVTKTVGEMPTELSTVVRNRQLIGQRGPAYLWKIARVLRREGAPLSEQRSGYHTNGAFQHMNVNKQTCEKCPDVTGALMDEEVWCRPTLRRFPAKILLGAFVGETSPEVIPFADDHVVKAGT
ncbi:hypothetical protein Bbelb_067140 [Branchiostoma belcheri]|nr:hypothetical protein Bbelb_067140 [Branchiostoma belcheri]